jgi:UDP-N-acetylmuramate--alanine ligase
MLVGMHIFFSGIGGTAIGPLALIAKQAGYDVSGSDMQDSRYIKHLKQSGVSNIHIGQTHDAIQDLHQKNPIDWIVYSSALSFGNNTHPELAFAKAHKIKATKRDELLNEIITDKNLKLVAVAGTHGKTTTTAMAIWLFLELNVPVSYSVGAKIPFGDMGHFDPKAEYFIYECDEFDRNFLAFHPHISLITGIDYDHHEIFPTRADYQSAFLQFFEQSTHAVVWQDDADRFGLESNEKYTVVDDNDPQLRTLKLPGLVNRRDALQAIISTKVLLGGHVGNLVEIMNRFPGLSRRFEKITEGLYTDYAHTIPKIRGCLQLAFELSKNVVVVYEPLTNRRQHYIRHEYSDVFKEVKKLYWVPSYLAREDPSQHVLTPQELITNLHVQAVAEAATLNQELKNNIQHHLQQGDLVVCVSGGGGGSLDEWLRASFR